MKAIVGIRREDKNRWERRTPLTPDGVARLVREEGLEFVVQPSRLRIFPDQLYRQAGARVDEDLSGCHLVMGVKEIPTKLLQKDQAYLYFSHTIKAQPYNMAMLGRLMDLGCTLLDYEIVVDDEGRRTVFFGVHAGLAGMGETLVALGRKLEARSMPNPFTDLLPPHELDGLAGLEAAVARVGERIARDGLPSELVPLVFGFTGYGNVSRGAQDVLGQLPVIEIAPDELAGLSARADLSDRHVYKVVFREEHMVKPREGSFDLQEYYDHPERYRSVFAGHAPHLDVLVNCIFWTERYPRLVTRQMARDPGRLKVVGDISCDIEGAIEFTTKATMPDEPCFTFHPQTGEVVDGIEGEGITVMAVDNLPCELSREASESFSQALEDLVAPMATADWSLDLSDLSVPRAVRDAMILHRGRLVPRFEHLADHAIRTSKPGD